MMRIIVSIIKVRKFLMLRLKMTYLMSRVMLRFMMWHIVKCLWF